MSTETGLPPPNEWNFDPDRVPNSELVACCYWEYARESPTLVKIRESYRKETRQGTTIPKWLDTQFPGMSIEAGDGTTLLYRALFSERSFPSSWQDLSDYERLEFTTIAQEWRWPAVTSELNRTGFEVFLDKANDWYAKFVRTEPHPSLNDTVPKVPDILFGVETMILQINWGGFSDRKLAQAFRKWVTHARPPSVPEPSYGRGHNPGQWRKKLRDMGIMRLMNSAQVGNMKLWHSDAWALYHDQKHWTERHWYLARERALKNFRLLLRFLPAGELPIHATTKSQLRQALKLKVNAGAFTFSNSSSPERFVLAPAFLLDNVDACSQLRA